MDSLSPTSRANFAKMMGIEAKSFIQRCELFSMRLSDAADAEKSEPLRLWMHKTSAEIDKAAEKVRSILGSTA